MRTGINALTAAFVVGVVAGLAVVDCSMGLAPLS